MSPAGMIVDRFRVGAGTVVPGWSGGRGNGMPGGEVECLDVGQRSRRERRGVQRSWSCGGEASGENKIRD